ncbi:MAG: c-type cytochrome [Planctomycetota bacterium]
MQITRTLLVAAFALPLLAILPSCGGGETTDSNTPETPATDSTPSTPSTPAEPAATEEAAKTDDGKDALEAMEEEAAGAKDKVKAEAEAAKEMVISEAARTMYDTYCFTCHGTGGKGDGPAGAALPDKPADFSSADWQATVTDEHIQTVIAKGGAAAGKSALMPPAPGVDGNQELLDGLTAIVRSFSK